MGTLPFMKVWHRAAHEKQSTRPAGFDPTRSCPKLLRARESEERISRIFEGRRPRCVSSSCINTGRRSFSDGTPRRGVGAIALPTRR